MYKTLILLPKDVGDVFTYFAFLIKLNEAFAENEVHLLLSDDSDAHLFHFLPFKVNWYAVSEEDLTLTKSGRLAYQIKEVFNVTHFFNLRRDVRFSYVGRAFRAKHRIGFAEGIRKFAYTNPVKPLGYEDDQSYMRLLNDFSYKDDKPITFRNKNQNSTHIVIGLSIDFITMTHSLLSETFDELKLVPMISLHEDSNLRSIFEELSIIDENDFESIVTSLVNSKGIITDKVWLARLACLYEVPHVLITGNERDLKPLSSIAMPLSILRVNGDKPSYYLGEGDEESLRDKSQVADLVLRLFKV